MPTTYCVMDTDTFVSLQQEKEALDDLTMELELADEDEPVLYVLPR